MSFKITFLIFFLSYSTLGQEVLMDFNTKSVNNNSIDTVSTQLIISDDMISIEEKYYYNGEVERIGRKVYIFYVVNKKGRSIKLIMNTSTNTLFLIKNKRLIIKYQNYENKT